MAQVIVETAGPLAVVDLNAAGVAKVYLGENTAEAASQAAAAAIARQEAEALALSIEVATAGGYFETVAEGAADSSVAEGDGYFVVTADGRAIIAKKEGGVGVVKAEFVTMYLLSLGAGGGINADKLDGNDASYFTDIISRLGYTPLDSAGDTMGGPLLLSGDPTEDNDATRKAYVDGLVTAAALLAKIKTVDGSGSGLDADTVKGQVPIWIAASGAKWEKRSDGRIECWDAISVPANGHTVWSLPATHTTEVFPACVGTVPLGDTAQYQNIGVASINTSSGAPVSITFQNAGDNTQVLYIRTTGK